MNLRRTIIQTSAALAFAACATTPAAPQSPAESAAPTQAPAPVISHYDKPPKPLLDVLHAPTPPSPWISPTRDAVLLVSWEQYPSIARVAEPYLKLAGLRIEPRNHSNRQTPGGYGINPCARTFEIVKVADGASIPVKLPAGSCAGQPRWSTDGKHFAFANTASDRVELWVGSVDSGEIHRVEGVKLNPMFGNEFQWLPDQKTLLVKAVPSDQGAPPPAPPAPPGPEIQETDGRTGKFSTYEARDTLKTAHDEDLFDYYAASQLAYVDAASGAVKPFGTVAAYADVVPAPGGEHLLVETIHKPYSHFVTADRFPRTYDIWNTSGKLVHRLADIPLADRVPVHGVRTGPREFDWRATDPATLVWAEALDNGDWDVNVPARDKVMMLRAPFTGEPTEILRLEQRFVGFDWTEKPDAALVTQEDENNHWMKTFIVDVDTRAKPRLLWDLSTDEQYKHPGRPVYKAMANGAMAVQVKDGAIFLSGEGASKDGDRPFLDKLDLATLKTERLFRSDKTAFERAIGLVGPNADTLLTWRQTSMDPPNLYKLTGATNLAKVAEGEPAYGWTSAAITHLPDPTPAVRAIKKKLIKYKRKDGLDLSATIYLPPGYKEGTRVPTILYAYPLDYASAAQAGQVSGSENTFTRLRDHAFLLLAGYAIIEDAAFPVIGDPKKAYDNYLEQLVDDAQAAVDAAVALGVTDPERVGVTGHSHGALMTVNLLAHSDLFRAGVATSGSYNKTITAFGFQSERRSVWEATDVYLKVSPFFSANKLKYPVLIMHGTDDANPGTTPMQAELLYQAIRGNGGTARLVMLPYEPHWYTAMESNEQEIYEMLTWFDKYVKSAAPRAAAKPAQMPKR